MSPGAKNVNVDTDVINASALWNLLLDVKHKKKNKIKNSVWISPLKKKV